MRALMLQRTILQCTTRGPAPGRSRRRGFTLLELMIAVAILSVVLVWSVEATTRAISAENHSKLMTTATFLARKVLVDLEDELAEKGMQDDAFSSEKEGTFEEDGFKRFKWRRIVDKITLPGSDVVQSALGKAQGAGGGGLGGFGGAGGSGGTPTIPGFGSTGGTSGGSSGAGAGGAAGSAGLFSGSFGLVKEVLEQGIRRVTVKVVWTEHGDEQVVEVNEYITDVRRVDQAVQVPNLGAIPGLGGATNSGSGSSTNRPPGT